MREHAVMASESPGTGEILPISLPESGDLAFVDALRAINDAAALAEFAGRWFDDRRPSSRHLMFEYLDRPLNAFRHEGLIKRLFKRAEAEGDDQLMARFLVLFDRSIRRASCKRLRHQSREVATEAEARELERSWRDQGYRHVHPLTRGQHGASGWRTDEVIIQPRMTTMPRGRMVRVRLRDGSTGEVREVQRPDWASWLGLDWEGQLKKADIRELPSILKALRKFRLFSLATRNYLRRRAWRYFRVLGQAHPERYAAAASEALSLYRDEDLADGLALIDNWGLVHILFHHCPAIEARPGGWVPKAGHSLAELAPAPFAERLWRGSPGAVVGLLSKARCRAVRRWAIRRVEADPASHRASLPLEGWVGLLGHDDPEIVACAAEILRDAEGLGAVDVGRWLALAEATHPDALEAVCELIGRHVRPEQVSTEHAVRLAGLRALPVARLGLSWLKAKEFRPGDERALMGLVEAECGPLRAEILRWLRGALAASGDHDPEAVLTFLDSRHADARFEGWAWFRSGPKLRDDVETWRKLLESPYDDVCLALVAELEARAIGDDPARIGRALDPVDLRRLWASVLLNVRRGARARPGVVNQLLRRLEASPGDAPALLPLLGVALRSVRGPERKAGLVAVVKLVEARAEVEPLVRSAFPELQLG